MQFQVCYQCLWQKPCWKGFQFRMLNIHTARWREVGKKWEKSINEIDERKFMVVLARRYRTSRMGSRTSSSPDNVWEWRSKRSWSTARLRPSKLWCRNPGDFRRCTEPTRDRNTEWIQKINYFMKVVVAVENTSSKRKFHHCHQSLQKFLFNAHSCLKPSQSTSCFTHSSNIFLLLSPNLWVSTGSTFLCSRCPNHLNLSCIPISAKQGIHKILYRSTLRFLF